MNKQFYYFRHQWKKGRILIQPTTEFDTLKLLGVKTPLKNNPFFEVKKGNKLFDIADFNNSSNFAISEKFKNLLEINNFSGWECFPIEINSIAEKYYAFQNISEAGGILNKINKTEDDGVIKFDISTWEGADIFHLKGTLLNICTEKVKNVLETNKVSNIEFIHCLGITL
ncbi:MAG: hypothetical protein LBN27_06550 [Prevotellaceae bacterium]|jgi:hypothetical protein|nr:hypothetical protein [Prevotellaceae bacterium]